MTAVSMMTKEEKTALKGRIEQVLSEILSDKYDCDIKLKFVPKERKIEDAENKEDKKSA